MKKIILSAFLVLSITLTAQRNVVWVHGLNDNAAAWRHYDDIFEEERKINTLRQGYTTSRGVETASTNLITNITNALPNSGNDSDNMGIGHSMGGVMLRDADRRTNATNRNFGGYITVASPNYGAPIADAIQKGKVAAAARTASLKLTAGPAAQLFGLTKWRVVAGLSLNVLSAIFLKNGFIEKYVKAPQSLTDLKEGSSALNRINNHNSNLPRISIWAQENSPVHWRIISSARHGNDHEFPRLARNVRGVYNGFYKYNIGRTIISGILGIFNPGSWAKAVLHGYRAAQWKKGRNWLDDSENIWSGLIKTTRVEKQYYWSKSWQPCDIFDPLSHENHSPGIRPLRIGIDCGSWKYVKRHRYVSVNYPSDGLLPQYTQELKGLPSGNVIEIDGANHLEVLTHPKTGTELRKIFDDEGSWFETPERD